jgi:hypothetical protein
METGRLFSWHSNTNAGGQLWLVDRSVALAAVAAVAVCSFGCFFAGLSYNIGVTMVD